MGFERDEATRVSYVALAGFAFWLYAFGPALALLKAQLHFSYTVLGVYSALWAAGAGLAGVTFAGLARRLGRTRLLWCSAAAATGGAALFAVAHAVGLGMTGAVILGYAGTTLLTSTQAILSDGHGARRDRALTEANVGAAGCAVVAPLLLGLLQSTPVGWRVVMGLPAVVLAGLFLRYRHVPLGAAPAARPAAGRGARARLPLSCGLLAMLTAVGVAVEFCVIYFGAELLASTGLRTGQAATAMSVFYFGILAGRVGAVGLTRRPGRTVPLLYLSLAVTIAGFLTFWLAGTAALAVTGLFVCGLGIANLYPLSLSLTLAAAPPGHGDAANARTQLLAGVLVVVAPYLLGSLADQLGLQAAFSVELVLIGACAALLVAGRRLEPDAQAQAASADEGADGARRATIPR